MLMSAFFLGSILNCSGLGSFQLFVYSRAVGRYMDWLSNLGIIHYQEIINLCLGILDLLRSKYHHTSTKQATFGETRVVIRASDLVAKSHNVDAWRTCRAMQAMLGAAKHRITSFQTPTEGSGLPPDCLVWQFVFWKAMPYIHE